MIKRLIRWGLLAASGMVATAGVMATTPILLARPALTPQHPQNLSLLVGTTADIAPSAYQYRADRTAEDNPPESWLALMWYAHQPLNRPVDVNVPAIKQVLCSLLWEEIRPVQRLELTWSADLKRRPAPAELAITTLDNKGTSSSWWNNLDAVAKPVKPTPSGEGRSYFYDLPTDTCGIVVSVVGGKSASEFDVPAVKVLVADVLEEDGPGSRMGLRPRHAGQGLQRTDRDLRRPGGRASSTGPGTRLPPPPGPIRGVLQAKAPPAAA